MFLSNALGSNMVLQRAPQQANLWGWSSPGSEIQVQFNGTTFTTVAQSNSGSWSLFLPPTTAGGPYRIDITSSKSEMATLENIYFGDVFVCSGQSNMEVGVDMGTPYPDIEIAKASNYSFIRVFNVVPLERDEPLDEFAYIKQEWAEASPETITEFCALCWFFGKGLYDHLQVPIGLICTCHGPSQTQTWSSFDALAECDSNYIPWRPSARWNAMLVPLLPMTIRNVVWYQGESNSDYDPAGMFSYRLQRSPFAHQC
jgi:sialate O-acetylesterase